MLIIVALGMRYSLCLQEAHSVAYWKRKKRKPTVTTAWESAAFMLVQGAPGAMEWGECTSQGEGCREDQEYGLVGPGKLSHLTQSGRK